MILLSGSMPWMMLPEPYGLWVSLGLFSVVCLGVATWSIYAVHYFVYQWRRGHAIPVIIGAIHVVLAAIVGIYAVFATAIFLVIMIIGLGVFAFSDEHVSWLVFAAMTGATFPGVAILAWCFLKRKWIDSSLGRWQTAHFPPDWTAN